VQRFDEIDEKYFEVVLEAGSGCSGSTFSRWSRHFPTTLSLDFIAFEPTEALP